MNNIFKYPIYKDIEIKEYLESFNLGIHRINQLVNSKRIKSGKNIVKFGDILKIGSTLYIDFSDFISKDIEPFDHSLSIVYEDEYLLIVDKPCGYAIYDEFNNECVDNFVKNYYLSSNLDNKVYHVHRLDKDTSGLIVYAKDLLTLSRCSYLVENKLLKRTYHALVEGKVKNKEKVESYLTKDRHNSNKMIVNPLKKGQISTLYYKLIKYNECLNTSKISVLLDTGRTHQIRVQMADLKHPVVNDCLYNPNCYDLDPNLNKLKLISYSVEFVHPITNEVIYIELNRDL